MTKKRIIIICAIVLVVLVSGVIIFFVTRPSKKTLEAKLENVGKLFYTDYYKNQEKVQKDVIDFAKGFEKSGIQIDLENLSKMDTKYKEIIDTLVNPSTNKKCDSKKSYIKIIPKKPYGESDYDIKVNLECGFKK